MSKNETVVPALVWGAEAIGLYLNKTTKAAFHMLERGRIPGARKIGGRWVLDPKVFHAAFEERAA